MAREISSTHSDCSGISNEKKNIYITSFYRSLGRYNICFNLLNRSSERPDIVKKQNIDTHEQIVTESIRKIFTDWYILTKVRKVGNEHMNCTLLSN